MSCLQITSSTALLPSTSRGRYKLVPPLPTSCCSIRPSLRGGGGAGASVFYANRSPPLRLVAANAASVHKLRSPIVCLFGDGKGKPGGNASEPPWKGLKNLMDGFKKGPSVEDLLKKQIQTREFAEEGGGGGLPPDSGGDGSRGPGDDDFSEMVEESLQVLFATLGFIFLYMYIINGDDMIQIIKDSVRYLFGARDSVRLQKIMRSVGSFFSSGEKEELPDNWLEAVIVNTPTWFDSPEKNNFILKHHPMPRPPAPSDDDCE